MGDHKLVIEAEDRGASRALGKYYQMLSNSEAEMREFAKSSSKAGKAGRDAMGSAAKGAKGARDGIKGANEQAGLFDRTMQNSLTNITKYIAGFAGLAGIKALIEGIKGSVNETTGAIREMSAAVIDLDTLAQSLAALRDDLSQEGQETAGSDIMALANKAKVSPAVAKEAWYRSESKYGQGPAARSAALEVSKTIAAFGDMGEGEVKPLIKLLGAMDADTPEKQRAALNMIMTAANESDADPGEYARNLVKYYVPTKTRGFDDATIFAKFNAALAVTPTAELAATMGNTEVDVASGRSEQAAKFFVEEAKRRGRDYTTMTAQQQSLFMEQIYNDVAGTPRELEVKTKVGGEAWRALLSMYSPIAKKEIAHDLPIISAAPSSGFVQDAHKEYLGTNIAKNIDLKNRQREAEVRTGREKLPSAILDQMAENIYHLSEADRVGFGENASAALKSKEREKHEIARYLVTRNLDIAQQRIEDKHGGKWKDIWADPQFPEIYNLRQQDYGVGFYVNNPKFVKQAYDVTEGFGMIPFGGEFVGPDTSHSRAINTYYDRDERVDPRETARIQREAAKAQLLAAEKQIEAAEKLNDATHTLSPGME